MRGRRSLVNVTRGPMNTSSPISTASQIRLAFFTVTRSPSGPGPP